MAKKIFLIFTIVMVLISSAICYSMVNATIGRKANNYKKITTDMTNKPSVTPLPTKAADTKDKNRQAHRTGITKGQKYYTSLSPESTVNILLVGLDPTYSNFDTMVIVSLNEKDSVISLIDLPRDMYIDYTDELLKTVKEKAYEFYNEKGNRKLNAAAAFGRKIKYKPEKERFPGKSDMNFLTDIISEIFEININDYIIVETDGFRELVDYFGGVVVDVPYYMHYEDPVQNLYIHLEPGIQRLDGAKAEGFVRFRQGYTRDGRFVQYTRSENTFAFLKAFYEQHVTLKNLSKTGKVYEIVKKNTKTSVNSLGEIYKYALLAKKVLENKYSIETVEIICEETKIINGARYELIKTK
ncbi:MAG: LytR family transcriptional regulator [Clostridiaceae bacterium]|nr:LytR family transcriptional regulator [Clostridiaceae bacterium]